MCLSRYAERQGAELLLPGDDPRARFRVRHVACDSLTDVSLPMLRKGWTCRACSLTSMTASGWVQHRATWSLDQQAQLFTVANVRPFGPMTDNSPGDFPINFECLTCGGAQTDSLFGISEGVRLSWLPCRFCNAQRFKPTHDHVAARLASLGLQLRSQWTGDPGAPLDAQCNRCDAPRKITWQGIGAGLPPCIRCDGARLDPDAPHRVYLFRFPSITNFGVFKVGITHCANDRRLEQHRTNGGELVQIIGVSNRATAFAIETSVLALFQTAAPISVSNSDMPQGGASECWNGMAGHPDLNDFSR